MTIRRAPFSTELSNDPGLMPECEILITTRIRVHDKAILARYAEDRYEACWSSDIYSDQEPKDMGLLALEALLLSNENPSPDDLGFEFVEHTATVVSGDGSIPKVEAESDDEPNEED